MFNKKEKRELLDIAESYDRCLTAEEKEDWGRQMQFWIRYRCFTPTEMGEYLNELQAKARGSR